MMMKNSGYREVQINEGQLYLRQSVVGNLFN